MRSISCQYDFGLNRVSKWELGRGHWIIPFIITGLGAVLSVEAHAQELGAQTIEQRVQQAQEDPTSVIPQDGFLLPREDGLILLRRPKLFSIESDSSYQFTDNAFLSDKQKSYDHILTQSLVARAGTQIAQRLDVFVSGSGFMSRYHRNQGLDFNGFTGSVGASLPINQWVMSIRYDGSATYNRNFDSHLVTLHNLGWDISSAMPLDQRTALYPFFSVLRVWADPDDFSNTSVALGATLVHSLTETLVTFLQGQADFRAYDDFFEPSTLEVRQDFGARLLVALNWTPREWVSMNFFATIARNESTISTLRYTNFLLSPSLRLIFRF